MKISFLCLAFSFNATPSSAQLTNAPKNLRDFSKKPQVKLRGLEIDDFSFSMSMESIEIGYAEVEYSKGGGKSGKGGDMSEQAFKTKSAKKESGSKPGAKSAKSESDSKGASKSAKEDSEDMKPMPAKPTDFGEPDWEFFIEIAFPPGDAPKEGCARLTELDGELDENYSKIINPVKDQGEDKFNPCYYTKAVAGLTPSSGGYPTPIDTHYPYEFAAPFLGQPGDGSSHHCPTNDNPVHIGECPKFGQTCGKDCATISDDYGIGHIPPFVPLAAIKNAYRSSGSKDICEDWFHYETHGCNILKSSVDKMVYKDFGEEKTIKWQPPVLIDGKPSTTYYRLEYGDELPACEEGNCRGPHYCSKKVADEEVIWGDFCPYVHFGPNSGKYRHPHLAFAALELWIANQCMPEKCPATWLDSPNGYGYGKEDISAPTSITWCAMEDQSNLMSQPRVSYKWPTDDDGLFPGMNTLYPNKSIPREGIAGFYSTQLVDINLDCGE